MSCLNSTHHGADTARRKNPTQLFLINSVPDLTTILNRLSPKYDELAALYGGDFSSKVTIAKVDATANDVPDPIAGFPTIKLFPAGAKDSPVEYSGSRTVEDLANFVKENGKHKVDAYAAKDEKKSEGEASSSGKAEAPAASGDDDHDEL